jgi:hypothetical protein
MSTRRSATTEATTKQSKQDKDARKIVMNVANELFSLMQGTRKQVYGVMGLERRRVQTYLPMDTDGMLDYQIKKLRVVDLCIQRACMGQPLSQSEAILLVNSIINGTIHQAKLHQYQIDILKMSSDTGNIGIAGSAYWRNFKERNKDILDSGVGVAQAACHKEWSSYLNFLQMFDLVYEQMNQAGVLEKRQGT